MQAGHAGLAEIARDLRITDVHPPLYFWLVSLWREIFGPGLFAARLLSVALGLGALALTGKIARLARLNPVLAMLLTMGCYGFTYTSVIARGFALAQFLLLAGVVGLLAGRRTWHFALAGALFGASTMSNYLSVFAAAACMLAFGMGTHDLTGGSLRAGTEDTSVAPRTVDSDVRVTPGRDDGRPKVTRWRHAVAVALGFLIFIPADLWWFLAQRGSRSGQFPPFSLAQSLARLAVRFTGDILGGLPLYVDGTASVLLAGALGLALFALIGRVAWRWRDIGLRKPRLMFALAALAPPTGLLLLGAIFNNTPIEVRYLTFSTPFVGLLVAGALTTGWATLLLAVQAASITGLMLAPQTMQPARAAARAAADMVQGGIVLLPKGNDGVGIVGAFAIEAPPALPLLLIGAAETPAQIRARIEPWHRVVLALPEQDAASRAAAASMRQALANPEWRVVAREPNVAVYERTGRGE